MPYPIIIRDGIYELMVYLSHLTLHIKSVVNSTLYSLYFLEKSSSPNQSKATLFMCILCGVLASHLLVFKTKSH